MTAQMATRLTLRTFKHKKRKVSIIYFVAENLLADEFSKRRKLSARALNFIMQNTVKLKVKITAIDRSIKHRIFLGTVSKAKIWDLLLVKLMGC